MGLKWFNWVKIRMLMNVLNLFSYAVLYLDKIIVV